MKEIFLTQLSLNEIRQIIREEFQHIISQISPNPKTEKSHKTVLNFTEGCKYACISKSHGYKLTSKGLIPHYKRGKRIYFDKEELDKWLLSNKVKSNDEINKDAINYIVNR